MSEGGMTGGARPEGNPYRPKGRSPNRPATSFMFSDGFVPPPPPRESARYNGCASVTSLAAMEAQSLLRQNREEKEEERRQLAMIIKQKEVELDQLLTARDAGILEGDLRRHVEATSDPGGRTRRARTSRRATAASSGRRGVSRAVSTPGGHVWNTSYYEQLCALPGSKTQQDRNRTFESPQQFGLSGAQWRLEKLQEQQRQQALEDSKLIGKVVPPEASKKFTYGLNSKPRGYLHEEVNEFKAFKDIFAQTHRSRFPTASRHARRFDTLATEGLEGSLSSSKARDKNHSVANDGGGNVITWVPVEESKRQHGSLNTMQGQFTKWAAYNVTLAVPRGL